ncbi:exodeoxyribonuclease VII large subunit [Veillonella sp. R32]|uniref:exodeoxyribonuclease VII large subunit n=1 Tax=Veillonella sp. R32 TaxID=2021312 RepID=UPI00138946E5|nr:exodeoxyribonuclease VII large subunit [Veillonella sp. R32]KAF1682368.1 exodeoxyribonuclease VII large subunit [Veillonella sp. R32]
MDVFSVTRLNSLIKRVLEREYILKNCYVAGTISNLKRHSTGHYYFSLKDEDASVDVALWAGTAQKKGLVNALENGLFVTMRATINFYEKTGRLSLICNDMEIGQKSPYQLEYEALKKELTALGYFDDLHKQPLPVMPTCIGLVTSESGAVLHDILHVAAQRNPWVQFKLFAVPVQGDKAGPIIAKGIERADRDKAVELIIVGRGGGSMEDLWCFNDRAVVEAVYHCQTPIVSAVGHETDYTLCDFAADVRGATPSHAAELSVYPVALLWQQLKDKEQYLHQFMKQTLESKKQDLQAIFNRKLGIPALTLIHKESGKLTALQHQLTSSITNRIGQKQNDIALLAKQLELLNPLHVLVKGYTKVEHKGRPIRTTRDVSVGDSIDITMQDGTLEAVIKEIHTNG